MKDFLEYLAKSIVKFPEDVKVEHSTDTAGQDILILSVHKDDMALVIGKEGKTIKSLRTLVKAKAAKEDRRVNVELSEPAQ